MPDIRLRAAEPYRQDEHSTAVLPDRRKPNLQVRSFQQDKRRILFVTSELADLVKAGGLGDVSAALPRALASLHDVRVLLPGYREVLDSGYPIRMVGGAVRRSSARVPSRAPGIGRHGARATVRWPGDDAPAGARIPSGRTLVVWWTAARSRPTAT